MSQVIEVEPIVATPSEKIALDKLKIAMSGNQGTLAPKLSVGPEGETVELPVSLRRVLREIVQALAQGDVVFIMSRHKELTTQQAADILNVSRPYLIKLLEEGKIPYIKTGTHRRIRFSDLILYKEQRDKERKRGLALLTQLGQELGIDD